MTSRGGYPVHNPELERCICWSCENGRRVKLATEQQIEARTRALEVAADLIVIHVMKDVFEFQLGDRRVNGKLSQILRDPEPYERIAVDAFLGLPSLEQYELLQVARTKKRIRVGDMKFTKDVEAEEAAIEAKRRGT